jgi:hypothetical protein
MKCRQMREMTSRHMDRRLDPDEQVLFDLHIRSCAACRKVLEDNLIVHESFASAEKFAAPYGFAARVMANLKEKERPSGLWGFPAFHPLFLRMVEVAFALIVVFIGLISGSALVAERPVPRREASIQQSFSLDVFEAAPPDSIAGIYFNMTRAGDER